MGLIEIVPKKGAKPKPPKQPRLPGAKLGGALNINKEQIIAIVLIVIGIILLAFSIMTW